MIEMANVLASEKYIAECFKTEEADCIVVIDWPVIWWALGLLCQQNQNIFNSLPKNHTKATTVVTQ